MKKESCDDGGADADGRRHGIRSTARIDGTRKAGGGCPCTRVRYGREYHTGGEAEKDGDCKGDCTKEKCGTADSPLLTTPRRTNDTFRSPSVILVKQLFAWTPPRAEFFCAGRHAERAGKEWPEGRTGKERTGKGTYDRSARFLSRSLLMRSRCSRSCSPNSSRRCLRLARHPFQRV